MFERQDAAYRASVLPAGGTAGGTASPSGAAGAGAIYTEHGAAIHILRMVILRVGAYADYLILKLH